MLAFALLLPRASLRKHRMIVVCNHQGHINVQSLMPIVPKFLKMPYLMPKHLEIWQDIAVLIPFFPKIVRYIYCASMVIVEALDCFLAFFAILISYIPQKLYMIRTCNIDGKWLCHLISFYWHPTLTARKNCHKQYESHFQINL